MKTLILSLCLFFSSCAYGFYDQPTAYYWPQPPLVQQLQQQEALGWQNYYRMQQNQQLFNINQNLQGLRYGY